jgi:hypothetical protein
LRVDGEVVAAGGADDREVAAVEGGDVVVAEPFGDGEDGGVDRAGG